MQIPHRMLMKLTLAMFSIFTSIFLLEIGLRVFTPHPITRTSNKIPDPRLGYRVDPKLQGIDERGFRNAK